MKNFTKHIIDFLIFLCIIALLFFGYQFYQDYIKVKMDDKKNYAEVTEKFGDKESDTCQDETIKQEKDLPALDLSKYKANESIGYIKAPSVGLKSAIILGDPKDGLHAAMNYGVSIDPSGKLPDQIGNTVIAGHREFAFAALNGIKDGTPVLINMDGQDYTYEVDKSFFIKDTETDKVFFDDGQRRVVLYTCYPFTFNSTVEGRWVVYLKPVDEIEFKCSDAK